jgi:exopolysaccharide/PEP-CTERM locus tyrosine autokinase
VNAPPVAAQERIGGHAGANTSKARVEIAALAMAGLIEPVGDYSRVAEEFRIIQYKLLRRSFDGNGATGDGGNLVMVTSALKGEGKSFTSINLAGEIARHGDRRVLLVDADPKAGGLRDKLGISAAPGILDLARNGGASLADVIIPTAADHLDVLPLGTNAAGSGELLASKRVSQLIQQIGRHYADRLIIFDAPPCLASSIPHTMAGIMGQTVLIVAANSTQQPDVAAALDLIQTCSQTWLLLNKIPNWAAHSFGSYTYNYAAG